MAKPKASKQREAEASKTRLYLTVDSALLKRFRHAAVELDVSESELFERLAAMHFGAVHARNVPENLRSTAPDPAGQGRPPGDIDQGNVVRITGITNRLDDISHISRRAHKPVDDALDSLTTD